MFYKVRVSVFRISVQTLLLVRSGFHNKDQNENGANKWSKQTLHGSKKLKSENTTVASSQKQKPICSRKLFHLEAVHKISKQLPRLYQWLVKMGKVYNEAVTPTWWDDKAQAVPICFCSSLLTASQNKTLRLTIMEGFAPIPLIKWILFLHLWILFPFLKLNITRLVLHGS